MGDEAIQLWQGWDCVKVLRNVKKVWKGRKTSKRMWLNYMQCPRDHRPGSGRPGNHPRERKGGWDVKWGRWWRLEGCLSHTASNSHMVRKLIFKWLVWTHTALSYQNYCLQSFDSSTSNTSKSIYSSKSLNSWADGCINTSVSSPTITNCNLCMEKCIPSYRSVDQEHPLLLPPISETLLQLPCPSLGQPPVPACRWDQDSVPPEFVVNSIHSASHWTCKHL